MKSVLLMIAVLAFTAGSAIAGTLTQGDFIGQTPEYFDGYDIATDVQDVDFGRLIHFPTGREFPWAPAHLRKTPI